MKKRISMLLCSLVMMFSCLFIFSACGKNKDEDPTISSISVSLANDNYSIEDDTITIEWGTKVEFDFDDFTVTATLSDDTTSTLAGKVGDSDGYTLTSTIPDDAKTPLGEYKLTFAYTGVTSAEIKVKVIKATVNMSQVAWNYTDELEFNRSVQTVTLRNVPEGVTPVYEDNAKRDVGKYTAKVSFEIDNEENYVEIPDMTLEWEIVKADYPFVNLGLNNFVYDGTGKTAVFNQVIPSEVETILIPNYEPEEGAPVVSVTAASKPGAYQVAYSFKITGADAQNYNEIPTQVFTWRIEKAPIPILTVAETFTYNATEQRLEASDFSGLPTGVTIADLENEVQTNAGRYTVTISLDFTSEVEGCYETDTYYYGWIINQAPLSVSIENVEIDYLEAAPSSFVVYYNNFVVGETSSVLGGELAYDLGGYTVGSLPGTYPITLSGLTSVNYDITFVPGVLTVSPIKVAVSGVTWNYSSAYTYNGTVQQPAVDNVPERLTPVYSITQDSRAIIPLNAGNYYASVSFVAVDGYIADGTVATIPFEIQTVDLTITAEDKTITYLDEVPTSTNLRYNGFIEGENSTVLSGDAVFGFGGYTNTSLPNQFTITVSGLTSINYNITFEEGTLTVVPIEVVVSSLTWNYTTPYTYNGLEQKPGINNVPTGVTPVVAVTQNSVTATSKNVGDYTASVTFTPDEGYVVSGSVEPIPFSIRTTELTIIAEDKTITYLDEVPTSTTLRYEGFVNEETASVLSGEAVFGFGGYTNTSLPNQFTITVSGLTSSNYEIIFEEGTLTVVPIEVVVSGLTWNYSTPYTYNGTEQKPELSSVPAHLTPNYAVTQAQYPATSIDSGSYTVSVTFVAEDGYVAIGSVEPVNFVIGQAEIDESKIYLQVNGTKVSNNAIVDAYITDDHTISLYNGVGENVVIYAYEEPVVIGLDSYNFSYGVSLSTEARRNYKELTTSSYSVTYNVVDIVDRYTIDYVSLDNSETTNQTTVYYTSQAYLRNALITSITPVFVEGFDSGYRCIYYSDKELTTPIDAFTNYANLTVVYIKLEREIGQDSYEEVMGSRKIELEFRFVDDTNGREVVVGANNSYTTDEETFAIAITNNNSENITAVLSNIGGSATYTIESEINNPQYIFSATYDGKTYSYSTNITILQSSSTEACFTSFQIDGNDVTNNEINSFGEKHIHVSNIHEELDLSTINFAIDSESEANGYTTPEAGSEDAPSIELINGQYFLRYTLVKEVEASEGFNIPASSLLRLVFYIKLNVAGEVDNDTTVLRIEANGESLDLTQNPIRVEDSDYFEIITRNEYAKIVISSANPDSEVPDIIGYGRCGSSLSAGSYNVTIIATDGTIGQTFTILVVGHTQPDPDAEFVSSVNVTISGQDMFLGDISGNVDYDEDEKTLVLTNWNGYNTLFVEAEHRNATIEVFDNSACEGSALYSFDGSMEGSVPVAGNYFMKITSADRTTSQVIAVTVSGQFQKLGEVTWNNGQTDVVNYIEISETGIGGNMVMTMDKTEPEGWISEDTYKQSIGSFIGYLGAEARNEISTEAGKDYFTIDKFSSSLIKYMCYTISYTDLVDSTNNGTRDNLNIKLEVFTEGTLKYVKFYLSARNTQIFYYEQQGQEPIPIPIYYLMSCEIRLYLATEAEVEAGKTIPVSMSVGGQDYDMKFNPTEWYDFGDVTLFGNDGGEFVYILVEEQDLNVSGGQFNLTFTWDKAYSNGGYTIITDLGFRAIGEGTTVSALVADEQMAFASSTTPKQISLYLQNGMAVFAITDESGWEIIPVYIVTENFDFDNFSEVTTIVPNLEKFELSITINGETVSTLDEGSQYVLTDTGAGIESHSWFEMTTEEAIELINSDYEIFISNFAFASGDTASIIVDDYGNAIDISEGAYVSVSGGQYGVGVSFTVYFNGYIPVAVYFYFATSTTPSA